MAATAESVIPQAAEAKTRNFFVDLVVRLVKEKPLGTIGGGIVLVLVLTGIFADVLAPYDFKAYILADKLTPPSARHILGTDNIGRDQLSRIIYGARISLIVGLVGAALDALVATAIGITSGFAGRKVDIIVQRFVDAWMCFPSLFLYLTVMAILGPGLLQVILVLGISSGIRSSRVVRSAVIGIKENLYVAAAIAIGAPTRWILLRHVLPNVMAPIIIIFTVGMGGMILQEATLSFLGFGIPPPVPSWGGMLSGPGRQYMIEAPWMALWPGLALSIVVYGINMLGDGVRDILDPRLRGGLGRYSGTETKRAKMTRKVSAEARPLS